MRIHINYYHNDTDSSSHDFGNEKDAIAWLEYMQVAREQEEALRQFNKVEN